MKALALPQIVKTATLVLLLFAAPYFAFGQRSEDSIDLAAVKWVTDFYQPACDYYTFIGEDTKIEPRKNSYFTDCFYIFQTGKQVYDTVTVFIYTIGIAVDDVGYAKLLVQKKYKDGNSQFEFLWDNPKNIDQIIKMVYFFDKYKGFSDSIQLECIETAVYTYKQSSRYDR